MSEGCVFHTGEVGSEEWLADVAAHGHTVSYDLEPQKHAAWCNLPDDHSGLCEGDQ